MVTEKYEIITYKLGMCFFLYLEGEIKRKNGLDCVQTTCITKT